MSANTSPRFSGAADPQWGGAAVGTSANTTKDLTSGTTYLIYTAPTDGGIVSGVLLMPLGTNTSTVARLWINNGSTTGTAANNTMVAQISLPATTNTELAALPSWWLPMPRALYDMKATYRLYLTFGTAVAAGFHATVGSSKFAS